MAGVSERSFDAERTVVVQNFPSNVGEDELTIHFQKEKYGGGDVDEVEIDGSVAFVTFDMPGVATNVLRHEQIINGSKLQIRRYLSWLAARKKPSSPLLESDEDSEAEDAGNATIYVSGLRKETTKDAVTLFYENKKRSGGGELCEGPGEEGYKRVSPTVACLTFVSSKDARNVLKKGNETPLELENNLLRVSDVFEPTHDRSILIAKNVNQSKMNEETFTNFVEVKRNADVFKVVFGKDDKAIVILKSEIDEGYLNEDSSKEDMQLDGSVISLELAPLARGIRISNIPEGTSSDDIRYKFSNKKIGGSQVKDMVLDRENGVAKVHFENSSVVSELVKKEHKFKSVPLTVIPYYDDFEELQEVATKTTEFSGAYPVDLDVMNYILNHEKIEHKFDLKGMKYDEQAKRMHFTKELDDPKSTQEFENKLKEFLYSFVKEEVKIPKGVFEKVKKAIEGKKAELEAEKVECSFKSYRVTFVGKKDNVTRQITSAEATIDKISDEAKSESREFVVDDKNKLKFLNFIDYFKSIMTEFPGVQIHGMESSSGKLSLLGNAGQIKDVQLRILQDLVKISEIEVKMSDRQKEFLQRTDCQIVNDELKNDGAMLMLITIEEMVGEKNIQTKIFSLTKCDNTKRKRLMDIVFGKTSEKYKQVDEETANFLAKSDKLEKFKKEQFDKNQVFIIQERANPCNLLIVCDESKMNNAEQVLTNLTDEMKVTSSTFRPSDAMKVRFLKEHCWDKIMEKQKSLKAEGVAVIHNSDIQSLQIKGTNEGRKEMTTFLDNLAKKVNSKVYAMTDPGMRKQLNMEETNGIISGIEKKHCCVIEKEIQPGDTIDVAEEDTTEATVVADGSAGTSATPTMNLPYHSMSFINDKEVRMASGVKITIVVGDLAQEQVDVIVNTTNDSLNLNGNACGKALLRVAGQQLANECKNVGKLKVGGMASTGPANLNCQRVYHVRSSSWDNGKGASILRQLIKKCLQQARKDGFTSIAIPAIGTGSLHFPRQEAAKIFFEEVASYQTTHPQSTLNDVRFVVFSGDQATVNAFLAAVGEIKSMVLPGTSRSTPASTLRNNSGNPSNVPLTEKRDGTLELSLGSGLTVEIVCADITNERTDLIMHVIGQDFSPGGGVAKALVSVGGASILQECQTLGKPPPFTTHYTRAGNLAVGQIAHVILPGSTKVPDLHKCVGAFLDDVSTRNIASVSFSAVGAGAMGYSENESAGLIFDNLSRISKSRNLPLKLVRIVIVEKPRFLRFKDATKAYFAAGGASISNPQPNTSSFSPIATVSRILRASLNRGSTRRGGASIKISSDDRGKMKKAWEELRDKVNEHVQEKIISDDVIKKFTDRDLEKLRKLERDFDFEIKADLSRGNVKLKGHILDIANVQGKINEILNDIKENKKKVPDYWDDLPANRKFHKVNLATTSKEYKEVETAFHKTARNQIVRIERIQNKETYELYNVKCQAMMKKYGSNFPGKELMLFHGTSAENIEKINSGGLNRSYAGMHATACGRGVYFARDASYSCSTTYSPADGQGNRYMYYAKVLVGEYTKGNSSMIVPPNKNSADPNETYESVVDNPANPSMYVLFQDYEFYTEYLITFK